MRPGFPVRRATGTRSRSPGENTIACDTVHSRPEQSVALHVRKTRLNRSLQVHEIQVTSVQGSLEQWPNLLAAHFSHLKPRHQLLSSEKNYSPEEGIVFDHIGLFLGDQSLCCVECSYTFVSEGKPLPSIESAVECQQVIDQQLRKCIVDETLL